MFRQHRGERFGFRLEELEVHDPSVLEGEDVSPRPLQQYAARSALSRDMHCDDNFVSHDDGFIGAQVGLRPRLLEALPLPADLFVAAIYAAVGASRLG